MTHRPVVDLDSGLLRALEQVNALRAANDRGASRRSVEELVDALFGASLRLAIYGSLAPGRENHSVIAGVPGSWRDGFVRGDLHETGWGAAIGYPAIRLAQDGPRVPVKLFESRELPEHWTRLDDFEGPEYCRKLVPVRDGRDLIAIANIYEAVG